MVKITSLIIYSDFGFFKKPETNLTYLTFEFIPKSTVLGVFGAILGLEGYNESDKDPEFYSKLKSLKIGIQPLELLKELNPPYSQESFNAMRKPYQKTFVKYNNYHGYGSYEKGGILNKREQILLYPAYRIFLRESNNNGSYKTIKEYLEKGISHYTPYMGKNDFSLGIIYEGEGCFNSVESDTVRFDTMYFEEIREKFELDLEEGRRIYNIIENYPYKLEGMQHHYKKARYSNEKIKLDKEVINKGDYEVLTNEKYTIFLF